MEENKKALVFDSKASGKNLIIFIDENLVRYIKLRFAGYGRFMWFVFLEVTVFKVGE